MGFGIKTKLFKVRDYFFERRFPLARKLINNDTTQYGEFSVLWKLLGRENEKTDAAAQMAAGDARLRARDRPLAVTW